MQSLQEAFPFSSSAIPVPKAFGALPNHRSSGDLPSSPRGAKSRGAFSHVEIESTWCSLFTNCGRKKPPGWCQAEPQMHGRRLGSCGSWYLEASCVTPVPSLSATNLAVPTQDTEGDTSTLASPVQDIMGGTSSPAQDTVGDTSSPSTPHRTPWVAHSTPWATHPALPAPHGVTSRPSPSRLQRGEAAPSRALPGAAVELGRPLAPGGGSAARAGPAAIPLGRSGWVGFISPLKPP